MTTEEQKAYALNQLDSYGEFISIGAVKTIRALLQPRPADKEVEEAVDTAQKTIKLLTHDSGYAYVFASNGRVPVRFTTDHLKTLIRAATQQTQGWMGIDSADEIPEEIFNAEISYSDFDKIKDAVIIGINFAECYGIRHDTDETTINIYRNQLDRLVATQEILEKMEKTLCLKD